MNNHHVAEEPVLDRPVKQDELRPGPTRAVLEDFTPFSQSHLWKLMMSFYDRQGIESWAQGIVPHFITSNAFIGHSYAKVLFGWLRDGLTTRDNPSANMPLDPNEPLYIVELGAGSGKFSHLLLRSLLDLQARSNLHLPPLKYIMTDFTKANFEFWTTHPALQPHVASGLIDFAIFDAASDTSLHLHISQTVLTRESLKNPLVIVANYLFDTLAHDLFQVQGPSLRQGLVSVGSKHSSESDPLDPAIIKRLSNEYRYTDIHASDFYLEEKEDAAHEAALAFVLEWYQRCYADVEPGATFLLPIGALRAVRRLMRLSRNRVVVLSGDKGHNHPSHFQGLGDPHLAIHGSFSVMVNYHAVGLYFARLGGMALHNPQEEASLKVSVFVLNDDQHENQHGDLLSELGNEPALEHVFETRAQAFPNLRESFLTHVSHFGPNDFFVLQQSLKEAKPALKAVVALLKLSHWDPDVFYKFRDVVLDQVPNAGLKLRQDLRRGLSRLWSNNYTLDREKDLAFEIARVFYGLRAYPEALEYYATSVRVLGPHHVTYHNMGLCLYSQDRLEAAQEKFQQALERQPNYAKARTWLERTTVARQETHGNDPLVDPTDVCVELDGPHERH